MSNETKETKEIKDKRRQYNTFLNYSMNDNSDSKFYGRLILSTVAVILLICICFLFLILYLKKHPENSLNKASFIQHIMSSISVKDKPGFELPSFSKRQNILILGVDSNGKGTDSIKGTRSDTIILANIDPSTKSVNLVSIPRDSKVYLPNGRIDKINSAHALGGIDFTKQTIEDTFGVKINHYIIIHGPAVREIVDAMGGIPVYVEKNMHYNDYSGDLHINLTKGLQVLDGIQAEGFLRFRHDGLGDIGRTSRQQWFLKGLAEKMQQPEMITKLPELVRVIAQNITTDMSFYELSRLAGTVKDVKIDDVKVATLPGGPSQKGYISYWILDPDKTQEVINSMIHRDSTSSGYNMVAGIMYSYDKEKEAMEVRDTLTKLGFEVSCMGRGQLTHSQFVAHSSAINSKFVNGLKKQIPSLHNVQFVFDPKKNYCNNADFTIIIAN